MGGISAFQIDLDRFLYTNSPFSFRVVPFSFHSFLAHENNSNLHCLVFGKFGSLRRLPRA